jgi:galactokinase
MKSTEWIEQIKNGKLDDKLSLLYGNHRAVLEQQRQRYVAAVQEFAQLFPNQDDLHIYSAPGRTEIGGNHTDHQHGCVLAAAINLDVIAIVAFHKEEPVIRLKSANYPMDTVELTDLGVHLSEMGKSASMIRGIAARFADMGVSVTGFDAYTTSDVLSGSGLSSSAAFEVLVGTIIDLHDNAGQAGAVEIAKIGQYAENRYFGKSSGLMDQMVSSVGGFVYIDFADAENPKIQQHTLDFEHAGYSICITDTKGSHANLTDDYVSVPKEMKQVAVQFGKQYLREVDAGEFFAAIPSLHGVCSDRAIMRAVHFFDENRRTSLENNALIADNLNFFFELIRQSGDSSANLLQNLYSCQNPTEQGIPLAIMMSKRMLGKSGAVRVHGGGFAGTIQAFVPIKEVSDYVKEMEALFGAGSCYVLRIRPVGGIEVTVRADETKEEAEA